VNIDAIIGSAIIAINEMSMINALTILYEGSSKYTEIWVAIPIRN